MQPIDDCDHPGQILVRLTSLEGQSMDISLAELAQDYSAARTGPSPSIAVIGPVHQAISQQLAKAKAELASARLKNAHTFHRLSDKMRFGRSGIRGDVSLGNNCKTKMFKYLRFHFVFFSDNRRENDCRQIRRHLAASSVRSLGTRSSVVQQHF